jgi:hypothetical protein
MDTPEAEHGEADKEFAEVLAEIRKIQAELRAQTKPGDFMRDDDLYDEWGAPK